MLPPTARVEAGVDGQKASGIPSEPYSEREQCRDDYSAFHGAGLERLTNVRNGSKVATSLLVASLGGKRTLALLLFRIDNHTLNSRRAEL
jgi:hypothetical protein